MICVRVRFQRLRATSWTPKKEAVQMAVVVHILPFIRNKSNYIISVMTKLGKTSGLYDNFRLNQMLCLIIE